MGWKYQGIEYITIPIETHYTDYPSHLQETNDYKLLVEMCKNNDLVYHKKWDRIYKLMNVALAGNGHRLKAWIEDIHTNKQYVCSLQDLEIIKKK